MDSDFYDRMQFPTAENVMKLAVKHLEGMFPDADTQFLAKNGKFFNFFKILIFRAVEELYDVVIESVTPKLLSTGKETSVDCCLHVCAVEPWELKTPMLALFPMKLLISYQAK